MIKFLFCALIGSGIAWAQVFSLAPVELNPATINLQDGSAASKANWMRMRLVSVNGQTGNYILAAGHGPQEGYIGEINDIINEDLGPVLTSLGVSECADIPTSGSGSAVLSDEGETYTISADFEPGTIAIPSFYDSPGTTLEKRIVVSEEGEEFLLIELNCEANDLVTVYVLMPETDDNPRAREVYYQNVPSTGETRVDVHMTNATDGEKYISRFHYENNIAKVWTIRTVGGNGSGEAAVIDTVSGLFQSKFHIGLIADSNSDTFTDLGTDYCIDMTTNAVGADCTGLTVANPVDTPEIGGVTHSYVMSSVKTMVLDDIQ